MRLLFAVIALAVVTSACTAPVPASVTGTIEPSQTSGPPLAASRPEQASLPSQQATGAPLPLPTMASYAASYPQKGWVVATAIDATGEVEHVTTYGWVKAGASLDVAYTCASRTRISIVATDGRATATGDTVFSFATTCSPGGIGRMGAPSTSTAMPINLDVTIDPGVRFWVKLGVPKDHLRR